MASLPEENSYRNCALAYEAAVLAGNTYARQRYTNAEAELRRERANVTTALVRQIIRSPQAQAVAEKKLAEWDVSQLVVHIDRQDANTVTALREFESAFDSIANEPAANQLRQTESALEAATARRLMSGEPISVLLNELSWLNQTTLQKVEDLGRKVSQFICLLRQAAEPL